ncbi:MAG: hypothetical protein VKI63_06035 [Cyanobium sp.]|nr:hypothetical protein [Cyanobium sp.]
MSNTGWVDTQAICEKLQIHRTTLWRVSEQGLLKEKTHWVYKNPTRSGGPKLWNESKVRAVFKR